MNQYQDEELPPEVEQQIDAVLESVLKMSDQEIDESYERMFPGEDCKEKLRIIAEKINRHFAARGLPCSPHVVDVLESTAPRGSVLPFTPVKKRDEKRSFYCFIPGCVAAVLILGMITWFYQWQRPRPQANHTPVPSEGDVRTERSSNPGRPGYSGEDKGGQPQQSIVVSGKAPSLISKQDVPIAPPVFENVNPATADVLRNLTDTHSSQPQNGSLASKSGDSPMVFGEYCHPAGPGAVVELVCYKIIDVTLNSDSTALQANSPDKCTELGKGISICTTFALTASYQVVPVRVKINTAESPHNHSFNSLESTPSTELAALRYEIAVQQHDLEAQQAQLQAMETQLHCPTTTSDCKYNGHSVLSQFSSNVEPQGIQVFYNFNSALESVPPAYFILSTNDLIQFWSRLPVYTPLSAGHPSPFPTPSPTTASRVPEEHDLLDHFPM